MIISKQLLLIFEIIVVVELFLVCVFSTLSYLLLLLHLLLESKMSHILVETAWQVWLELVLAGHHVAQLLAQAWRFHEGWAGPGVRWVWVASSTLAGRLLVVFACAPRVGRPVRRDNVRTLILHMLLTLWNSLWKLVSGRGRNFAPSFSRPLSLRLLVHCRVWVCSNCRSLIINLAVFAFLYLFHVEIIWVFIPYFVWRVTRHDRLWPSFILMWRALGAVLSVSCELDSWFLDYWLLKLEVRRVALLLARVFVFPFSEISGALGRELLEDARSGPVFR